jgi:helicase SWR1
MDMGDFEAEGAAKRDAARKSAVEFDGGGTPVTPGPGEGSMMGAADPTMEVDGKEEEDEVGGVDEYMLRLVEWDWASFATYR